VAHELLQADLAVRLFEREHGQPPASLAELVPVYLDTVPVDRYSNQPLRYHVAGGQFTLYSVGRDHRDNGGRFANLKTYLTEDSYDFDIDTVVRQ